METSKNYVFASIKDWHIIRFEEVKELLPGSWHVIDKYEDLNLDYLLKLQPVYIFFPHWSKKVPEKIVNLFDCVCFHETDLPYGKGGSPIQNLISEGKNETFITAFKMTNEFDNGPIYLKKPLSLKGLAEEIYINSSHIIIEMMKYIVKNEPKPKQQSSGGTVFKRRTPKESYIPEKINTLSDLFDFVRMLDADGYPRAKINTKEFTFEFSRPALRKSSIEASVKISLNKKSEKN